MIGFGSKGIDTPGAQLDDALRRQFLDRLADVQVACWGADNSLADTGTPAYGSAAHVDPMLTATPESVLIGLQNRLNYGSASPANHMSSPVSLSENDFATWDRLDRNRQLLNTAKSLTVESQKRAQHAMVSAGLVGFGALFVTAIVGWFVVSAVLSGPSSGHAAVAGIQLPHVPLADLKPIDPVADALPIQASTRTDALLGSHAASALAGHFSRTSAPSTGQRLLAPASYLMPVLAIEVTPDGEIPLHFKVHNTRVDLPNSYALIADIPSGVVPTIGASAPDGRWRLQASQLQELSFLLGASPPDRFDLRVGLYDANSQLLTEIWVSVALHSPRRSLEVPSAAGLSHPVGTKTQATAPELSASSKRVKSKREASPDPLMPPANVQSISDERPVAKKPLQPRARQVKSFDGAAQMGVGVEAVQPRASISTLSARPAPTTSESWWKKPPPAWSRDLGSAN